jgi:hypothetical protein
VKALRVQTTVRAGQGMSEPPRCHKNAN